MGVAACPLREPPPPLRSRGLRAAREALEAGLTIRRGRRVRIVGLDRHALEARSTYPIDRLDVRLESGERFPLVFKRLHRRRGAKGNRREVLIYERLLDGRRFGAPALYASVYDEARGTYWLFLEDVGERTLNEGDRDEWLAAVRWLATMHGSGWGRAAGLRALGCLGEQGREYYWRFARAARLHIVRAEHPGTLRWFDRLMVRFDRVVEHLLQQPLTLVHGDVFPHNVLLQPGPRVRPVDWESAALGPGAWDLTRLLDGWGADAPAFRRAYLSELAHHVPLPLDERSFRTTMAHCDVLGVLCHLAWEARACEAEAFVTGLLEALEAAWHRLDRGEESA